MSLYALDDVDDAFAATREFLTPLDWSRWWRLAVVALFLGGANVGGQGLQFTTSGGDFGGAPGGGPEVSGALALVILGVVVAAVALGLVLAWVGSVMRFVLVESLRSETVHVRRFFRRYARKGLRLLAFRVVVGLLSAVVMVALFAAAFVPLFVLEAGAVAALALVVVLPLALVAVVVVALVDGFTTSLVVPVMVREDVGVLDGWRRFYPVVRSRWKEYGAYALMKVGLGLAAGVVVGFGTFLGVVVLGVPFALLGLLSFAAVGTAGPVGVAMLVVVGLLFVLSLFAFLAFVRVPVVVFFQYYALLVLGDTDEDLDLVPERRAAIRGTAGDGEGTAA